MLPRLEPFQRTEGINVLWQALAWPGVEHLSIEERKISEGYVIDGLIVGVFGDRPSRLWYRMELSAAWTFQRLNLTVTDGVARYHDNPLEPNGESLELIRTSDGRWDHDQAPLAIALDECVDIDIAVTPFTNTLPIRRLNLYPGESAEITVVYIAVPELTLAPARQRYTRLGDSTYRFESLVSGFTADITVDTHGLVVDYPGLFRRIWPD